MKKILLIIPFLIGGITIAQAQSCSVNECGEDPNRACKTGGFASCERLASPIPNGNSQGCAWLCLEDPRLAGINTNQSNNQKDDKPKTCLKGETLKNGECKPDCIETLKPNTSKPNTSLTSQDMYARWTSRQTKNQATPSKPERIVVGIPGPTISGFINPNASCAINLVRQAGPGIGTQIPAADLARYNTCLIQGRPIACAEELYEALDKNPAFDEILKKRCLALPPNTNANVFDALWGFLTHRQPY